MAATVMATELLHPALREPARLVGAAREMVPMAVVVRFDADTPYCRDICKKPTVVLLGTTGFNQTD